MLITHFIGLAMAVGSSFAFFFHILSSSNMAEDARTTFLTNANSLGMMGNIGLALSFLSGGYLMTPYWSELGSMPLLIAKLILFLVFGALLGITSSKLRKAKKNESSKELSTATALGRFTFLVALIIIVLAVFIFH